MLHGGSRGTSKRGRVALLRAASIPTGSVGNYLYFRVSRMTIILTATVMIMIVAIATIAKIMAMAVFKLHLPSEGPYGKGNPGEQVGLCHGRVLARMAHAEGAHATKLEPAGSVAVAVAATRRLASRLSSSRSQPTQPSSSNEFVRRVHLVLSGCELSLRMVGSLVGVTRQLEGA